MNQNKTNQNQNILVIYYFYKSKISGVADVIEAYTQELLKQKPNCQITVLCQNVNNEPENETINGIDIVRFQSSSLFGGRIPLPSVDLWRKANSIIKSKNITQIHNHTRFSTASVIGLLAGKTSGVEVIHWEHLSNYILGEKWLLQTICWLWDQTISRLLFNQSDKIIAVSTSTKNFICDNLGADRDKTIVIENGCHFKPKNETIQETFEHKSQPKRQFQLFYGARLVPLKNPILTLQSILELSKLRTDFRLTMAGNGKLEQEVKAFIADNNLSQFVDYVGVYNASQMSNQLLNNDLFLNLSYLEGLPGGVLEAMFNNNLCLVSDVGGNNDLITVPELLVDLKKATPSSIANAIDYILNNLESVSIKAQIDKDRAVRVNNWQYAVNNYLTS